MIAVSKQPITTYAVLITEIYFVHITIRSSTKRKKTIKAEKRLSLFIKNLPFISAVSFVEIRIL